MWTTALTNHGGALRIAFSARSSRGGSGGTWLGGSAGEPAGDPIGDRAAGTAGKSAGDGGGPW